MIIMLLNYDKSENYIIEIEYAGTSLYGILRSN